jgi:hypothetical protein
MAIDPGATTAYAAQRYAPRPTRNGAVVGREMTAKQRDFIVTLALDVRRLQAASLLLCPLPGGVSVKDRDMIAADMIAPATIVREVQATLNRTDIGARTLITNMIAQRDRARTDFRNTQAKYCKTASSGHLPHARRPCLPRRALPHLRPHVRVGVHSRRHARIRLMGLRPGRNAPDHPCPPLD